MQSKYESLECHLKSKAENAGPITLSFSELNRMLPSPLPESAYTHRPWWANQKDGTNRPQAKSWMSAGFEVEEVKQTKIDGWVRFVRIK